MSLNSALSGAGAFKPQEIVFLRTVLDQMTFENDTEVDRQTRAAALVRLYQSGIRTPQELFSSMGYAPVPESTDHGSDHTGLWRRLK